MNSYALVKQSVLHDHMLRLTREGDDFRVTFGINVVGGNTALNCRYLEWKSSRKFLLATDAWAYGERIVRGATDAVVND